FAEKRIFGPQAAAGARPVGFPGVGEGRMLRSYAAVDDRDDYSLPIQSGSAAQADVIFEQAEKLRAVAGAERAHLVFPDTQHFRLVLELVGLGGRHASRETVQAVAVAVDLLRGDASEDLVLLLQQTLGVALHPGSAL